MSVLMFLGGVLFMVVAIGLSIALHEVGHLLPAKKFGLRVPQYMIGFGKTIFSVKRGETEYGLKTLPLGGYISMVGMYPPRAASKAGAAQKKPSFFDKVFGQMVDDARSQANENVEASDEGRLFYQLPIYKRIIIMLGGPFVNLLLGFLLIGVVITGFGVPTATTTVSEVYQCIASAENSEATECTANDKEAPAYAAGLLPGDTITAVNGAPVAHDAWYELTGVIRDHPGESIALEYERGGIMHDTTLTPYLTERPVLDADGYPVTDENGAMKTAQVGFVGMGSQEKNISQPVTEIPGVVGDQLLNIGNVILHLPQRMVDVAQAAFGTEERDPNGPVSIVGVGRIAGEINAHEGIEINDKIASLLSLAGGLNLALFAFNLIPLLPLDGGHVIGALYEGLKRTVARIFGKKNIAPVDTIKLLPLTYVVVAAMLVMGGLLIYADIFKPITIF
ncbi:zinc metalloprotease [Arthrobacter sp. MYb211]|uniref:M50 family metallopeptidase n=1 Tax=Micrococcaceae TaxID=1268 RepID=UPI000CFB6B4E|nr:MULTISPECIES: site-2 protease family protein [unclassified Arthrobacter]PRA02510.1 zinc metalloprotease [Arthrobacter sp. MYb229]PRA13216.1 zinc metalloprotease [Arthrobacter sp. MYb221]PRB50547.1 zinc metalloprotease [Arthrobacter sp. MYb216]PRC10410.1 zinc metalloprotease [Arthrobacter sp. MYb211]